MNGNYVELARRLTTLSQRFSRVSAELAEAGRSLLDRRALPGEGLVEELGAVQADFDDLRAQVVAAASALAGGAPPPVTTLRELEVLIRAISDRETARARRRAEEEAGDAQRRAAEESRRVAEEAKRKAEAETRRKADEEATRKAELEGRRKAEEEAKRKAEQEAKRKGEDEAKRKAEEDVRRRAAAEGQAKTEAEARRKADEEARRRAQDEAQRRAEEAAREQAELRRRGEPEAKRKAEEEARRKSEEQVARREAEEIARRQAEEDTRRRGEEDARRREEEQARRPAEEPVEAPVAAAEDEGQDLGLETAQWWISASASWASLKSKQTAFAAAVHDILAKYPYVFSVPIQSSTDYEDGLLAYGYAVLLDHLEQRRPGFVEGALDHLPVRQGASLGRRLYDYLAAALRESYVEFVKAIMVAALPRSPLWVTAGVEDSDTATTAFTRPTARIGDPTQKTERATQDQQRFADRRFVAEVAPLTTRFFRVEAEEVREPRVVDIRLSEKSAPSDQAWLVMTPRTGAAQARRQERQGTMIAGVGRDYTAVWIAVFNTDAETEKRFELTVGVRKRGAGGASSSFRKPR